MVSVDVKQHFNVQSSGAVWKSRWPSWAPVPNKHTVFVDVKQHFNNIRCQVRAQELCESRGGRPGLPVPNKRDGFCGRKQH